MVGPGWLEYLLFALDADPRHGLAGPSTNRAWNEQGAFPQGRDSLHDVRRTARKAERLFGRQWKTLEPLHSLADFCYLVRREVVEKIGAADEGFGLGPCWEMDYNIRAQRAGFAGVWACPSYVYRYPFTARRQRDEAQWFEAGRRRYQDKFCGLRLSGGIADYEPHCRGDACEHFAPRGAISVFISLPVLAPTAIPPAGPPMETEHPQAPVVHESPLVSCIMPTGGRREFAAQAARYFLRQDYSSAELIVVDDGADGLEAALPASPRIRYLRVPAGWSIGAKRNYACERSQGEIIAQWDDDDWHGPQRLSAQIEPIVDGYADVTALRGTIFLDLDGWRFWRCSAPLHRRLFVEDVHGGTLVFARRLWADIARYPNQSLAEDAVFLRSVLRRGARLQRIDRDDLFIYLRHGENSWSFACGRHVNRREWMEVAEPELPPEDLVFYERSRSREGGERERDHEAGPLVSCIMPTADRRLYVPRAVDYFLRQDYPNRELIVLDDGTDAVEDLMPEDPRIRYVRLSRRQVLGDKRNQACEMARGSIILHWDDDDWQAPWRVRYQVAELLKSGASLCGLRDPLFFQPEIRRAWRYVYADRGRPWVYGATMCYTVQFWRKHPFPKVSVGEDTRFVWKCRSRELLALEDSSFFVATVHGANSSPKRTSGPRWRHVDYREIERMVGADIDGYLTLA